jgi:hypothetical protein
MGNPYADADIGEGDERRGRRQCFCESQYIQARTIDAIASDERLAIGEIKEHI